MHQLLSCTGRSRPVLLRNIHSENSQTCHLLNQSPIPWNEFPNSLALTHIYKQMQQDALVNFARTQRSIYSVSEDTRRNTKQRRIRYTIFVAKYSSSRKGFRFICLHIMEFSKPNVVTCVRKVTMSKQPVFTNHSNSHTGLKQFHC